MEKLVFPLGISHDLNISSSRDEFLMEISRSFLFDFWGTFVEEKVEGRFKAGREDFQVKYKVAIENGRSITGTMLIKIDRKKFMNLSRELFTIYSLTKL
jgi:hypothetical protein